MINLEKNRKKHQNIESIYLSFLKKNPIVWHHVQRKKLNLTL